jgi:two-component system, OmpR family, osmolarity sensor histidine kinase EnvZ
MAIVPAERAKRLKLGFRGRMLRFWQALGSVGAGFMPKGLYARALIIIIAPIVLLQSVLVFVIMERHWEYVTRRLTQATVADISALVSMYETFPLGKDYQRLTEIARSDLSLTVHIAPGTQLPPSPPKPFFGRLDRMLTKSLHAKIEKPFWVDTIGSHVDIHINLGDGKIMEVRARRNQTYASNTPIFLGWMLMTSIVLLTVAVLFLRNQIRPILSLATAAERFGRGQPAPRDFRIRGAREVRQAALAFIEMRDRIERHVTQRTTMLAGVSHDLRTVLTRFRLQLAMMKPSQEVEELVRDVDDMQAMLEDYLAFARGGTGEEAQPYDVRQVLSEIHSAFGHTPNCTVTLNVPETPMTITIRRNAFKRAIMNLTSNATKFGRRVAIAGGMSRRNLVITVDDNGPGVPADSREAVFRPFYSLDGARNQNVKSTGLGLAITRDIIRAHGGEIHLSESRMGGLKATIRIPL